MARLAPALLAAGLIGNPALPPPPAAGSPAQVLDGETFLRTRAIAQQDPSRWAALRRDTQLGMPQILPSFSCALGLSLAPGTMPALFRLSRQIETAIGGEVEAARKRTPRARPMVGNHLPICVSRFTGLSRSSSYPSGEAALGWSLGLILTELAPDRAAPILAWGQRIGASRVACGVDWLSDSRVGMLEGAAIVAMLHGGAEFRAELAQAGRQLQQAGGTADHARPGLCPGPAQGSP